MRLAKKQHVSASRKGRGGSKPAFYTTHQVASYLGVSIATVVNWVNQGRLSAQRTPGGHRRIPVSELVRFSQENEYPLPPEFAGVQRVETGPPKVLLVHGQRDFAELVRDFLGLEGRAQVKLAGDALTIGFELGAPPDVVVIDLEDAEVEAEQIHALPWPKDARPVLVGSTTLLDLRAERLVTAGVLAEVIERTADLGEFVRRVRAHLPG